jgi:hypothetical protein
MKSTRVFKSFEAIPGEEIVSSILPEVLEEQARKQLQESAELGEALKLPANNWDNARERHYYHRWGINE